MAGAERQVKVLTSVADPAGSSRGPLPSLFKSMNGRQPRLMKQRPTCLVRKCRTTVAQVYTVYFTYNNATEICVNSQFTAQHDASTEPLTHQLPLKNSLSFWFSHFTSSVDCPGPPAQCPLMKSAIVSACLAKARYNVDVNGLTRCSRTGYTARYLDSCVRLHPHYPQELPKSQRRTDIYGLHIAHESKDRSCQEVQKPSP